MRVLDLFAGIGGFSLGLEAAGMQTVAFCENARAARRVLAKNWPGIPCFDDIRRLTVGSLHDAGIIAPDVVTAGFPCQDISRARAAKALGIAGPRSGLWVHTVRLLSEMGQADCGPRWVVLENVAALRSRGLYQVLDDLASLGFDAWWDCLPALAFGAPHRRDRIFIVAHSHRQSKHAGPQHAEMASTPAPTTADADASDEQAGSPARTTIRPRTDAAGCNSVRNADGSGLEVGQSERRDQSEERSAPFRADWWASESGLDRMADGIPNRVDRLKCLGNAIVPKIAFTIGKAIVEAEAAKAALRVQ